MKIFDAAQEFEPVKFRHTAKHVLTLLMLGTALSLPSVSQASCPADAEEYAAILLQEANANSDEIEQLVLLKKSIKACPQYLGWLELGKLQLELDNSIDAVKAFESARDSLEPDTSGTYTRDEMRRLAISNAWLVEVYLVEGDIAPASVAVQNAARAFNASGAQLPGRLVQRQREIDDALAVADSSVLARSLQLQHQGSSRGIGVRLVVREANEDPATEQVTESITVDYAGAQVSAVDTVAYEPETPSTSGQTESRLNIPVLFEFDSDKLTSASHSTIKQISAALNALQLESGDLVAINGHTDSQGAAAYNLDLSKRRANAVLNVVQQLLSSPARVEAFGLGESELRYPEQSSDDRRLNRRVEIVVRR